MDTDGVFEITENSTPKIPRHQRKMDAKRFSSAPANAEAGENLYLLQFRSIQLGFGSEWV